jgi:hypothetical protein
VAGGVERGALLPFLGARPGRFLRVEAIGARRASDGGRRMLVGELGCASLRRDGSLAGGFFLVDMVDPLACEHRHQERVDRKRQPRKLLMCKRKKFQNSSEWRGAREQRGEWNEARLSFRETRWIK